MIILMPIRIRLSILMSIQIRILPHIVLDPQVFGPTDADPDPNLHFDADSDPHPSPVFWIRKFLGPQIR
jgi:hypothetical protein